MKPVKIEAVIKQKIHKLAELAEQINKNFDSDAIHDFRVTVKSLRAFLRLISCVQSDKKIKIPEKINRLYHILGSIRDAEQERKERISTGLLFPAYLDLLGSTINRGKANWESHYTGKELHLFHKKIADFEFTEMNPSVPADFCNTKITQVITLCKKVMLTDKEIHDVRKQLKDMYYIMEIITQYWPEGGKHIKMQHIEKINLLATEIGNYNDKRLRLEYLTTFIQTYTPEEEKQRITVMCNEEITHLMAQKKQIVKQMQRFLEEI